jgi:hypothetical protein
MIKLIFLKFYQNKHFQQDEFYQLKHNFYFNYYQVFIGLNN